MDFKLVATRSLFFVHILKISWAWRTRYLGDMDFKLAATRSLSIHILKLLFGPKNLGTVSL